MFGKLNSDEIEKLLKQQLIGRIGCHADGFTYVVPVSYVYDGECVYVHTYDGLKLNMMRKQPKVCFEVDDTTNLSDWKSVVAWGEFEELTKEEDKDYALQKLNERVLPVLSSETMRIFPLWPFSEQGTEKKAGIFFCIKLSEKTGRFERSSDRFFYST
jgi:nitroimidazol reductase NimA-like FMN-containing flavoprotein (pyridoxamine 5'-phosphate oxidase superfamily)